MSFDISGELDFERGFVELSEAAQTATGYEFTFKFDPKVAIEEIEDSEQEIVEDRSEVHSKCNPDRMTLLALQRQHMIKKGQLENRIETQNHLLSESAEQREVAYRVASF